MMLDNLLAEERFDAALYYLKENGFLNIYDLAAFDFDELFFVPGMDDSLIREIRERYEQTICIGTMEAAETAPEGEVIGDPITTDEMHDVIDAEPMVEAIQPTLERRRIHKEVIG